MKSRPCLPLAALAAALLVGGATPALAASAPITGGATFRDGPAGPLMAAIPAGRFQMGSPPDEPGRQADEGPQRQAEIPQPFALAVYDVTRADYARFVEATGYAPANPRCDWRGPTAHGAPLDQGPREPVVCVSWTDAIAYVRWLSSVTGQGYRLPTEAEWEYAARAGSAAARPWGPAADPARANTATEPGEPPSPAKARWPFTSPVGSFPANGFGLYDMLGDVWQWTADCARTGPCDRHALRGGGWFHPPQMARSASRVEDQTEFRASDIGFRVARSL